METPQIYHHKHENTGKSHFQRIQNRSCIEGGGSPHLAHEKPPVYAIVSDANCDIWVGSKNQPSHNNTMEILWNPDQNEYILLQYLHTAE
jgi:hypothetical protein